MKYQSLLLMLENWDQIYLDPKNNSPFKYIK